MASRSYRPWWLSTGVDCVVTSAAVACCWQTTRSADGTALYYHRQVQSLRSCRKGERKKKKKIALLQSGKCVNWQGLSWLAARAETLDGSSNWWQQSRGNMIFCWSLGKYPTGRKSHIGSNDNQWTMNGAKDNCPRLSLSLSLSQFSWLSLSSDCCQSSPIFAMRWFFWLVFHCIRATWVSSQQAASTVTNVQSLSQAVTNHLSSFLYIGSDSVSSKAQILHL